MRKAKLQMVTSHFEIVNLNEDETFGEFYSKLSEIVNSMSGLGEKVLEVKVVEKNSLITPSSF